MIGQEELKEYLDYDSFTGVFTWKVVFNGRMQVGKIAGKISDTGYRVIKIKGRVYSAHRLAFLYMTGSIPKVIDHINGIRDDNRWGNLRSATTSQNAMNRKNRTDNTSGIKGVSWHKSTKKWEVRVMVNGKSYHFGLWDDREAAELVSILAREKYHGEYCRIK